MSSISGLVLLSTLYHIYLIYVKDPKKKKEIDRLNFQAKSNSVIKGNQLLNEYLTEPRETRSSSTLSTIDARSVRQQFMLAFSVVENTRKLCSLNQQYAALNGLQLIFTFFLFTSQTFAYPFLFTPQLLRNMVNTVPYESINSGVYWFSRTPSVWTDGLMMVL